MRTRARQKGWVGLIGLLLALVVVALLGRSLLKQMGVFADAPRERAVAKRVSEPVSVPSESASPSFTAPMERARGVEQQLQQQAREQAARIDAAR
jgi:hypothetical protein